MRCASIRIKSIGVMFCLLLTPFVAFSGAANNGGSSQQGSLNENWLANYTIEQVDYQVNVDLYGSDLEIRLSSTKMYEPSARQAFDLNNDGVVDWSDVNSVNDMMNQNMEFNSSDLPEVKLDGIPVTRMIGSWCHFDDLVQYNNWDTTVNMSEMQPRQHCEFMLLVEEFNSSTSTLTINSTGDELNVTGNVYANSWHGLNLYNVMNTQLDGTVINFNASDDGQNYWMQIVGGLQGEFSLSFDIDYEEYDVCYDMDGYSWDEALELAQNQSTAAVQATIVMINDAEELELVSELLGHNGTWVGASQNLDTTTGVMEPNGGWTNLDGTVLNSSLWAYGEPNDWGSNSPNGGEDLVELWPWSGLNDIDEHARLPVLIEYYLADGTSEYQLFGGQFEVSCEDQEDWWDWQNIDWIDYSLWMDMVGDEIEVVISASESIEVSQLLQWGDSDGDGILSTTEIAVLEQMATNEMNLTDLPDMVIEGEVYDSLDSYSCDIVFHQTTNADGTVVEGESEWASLECKWIYLQQIAYDAALTLTVEVEEYDVEDEAGWLSIGLGWNAVSDGYEITDAYDINEELSEIYLDQYYHDYWGGEHHGMFGTIVIELEQTGNSSDYDEDDHEHADYGAWVNVLDSEVEVELMVIKYLDAVQFASLDSDSDGEITDAEIDLAEQYASSQLDTNDMPPIYVNDVLLTNLEDADCEIYLLDEEMDALNFMQVAELECWFYYVDEFEFTDMVEVVIEVEDYDENNSNDGMIFAELGEDAADNGWQLVDVYDIHADQSGVHFEQVDSELWEADHFGNHGTYVLTLMDINQEEETPEEMEDLAPQCEVAWSLETEMMEMEGQTIVIEPSVSMDLILGVGNYALYVYCHDPNGDIVDVTVSIDGVEVGTFSATEAEGYVDFEVPSDLSGNVTIGIEWESTSYSGEVTMNIAVDGEQNGILVGNFVPGFSGGLALLSIVGALAIAGRRVGSRLE